MPQDTITAFYENYDDAARAVSRLEAAGIPHADISLVANNMNEAYSQYATRSFEADESLGEPSSAAAGATIGTIAGGGAGLLAGLGMLAVPGLGPVVAAGWLVSMLVGAGAGAAVGGLAGALIDAGVSEDEANVYTEGVRRGGALVTVRADAADMGRVLDILDGEGRVDIEERQTSWRLEDEEPAPPIGAAGSTTTGLTTDMMPVPGEDRTKLGMEDERERELRERSLGER